MRCGRLLVVAVTLLVASVGWAQIWYGGVSAYELGRGGTGVAVPSGPATGSNNPAALGMLYRMPAARPESMAGLEGGGWGLASWDSADFGRGLLAFPRGSEFGGLDLDLEGDDWLASALPPAGWLDPWALPREQQVLIESRIVTVDQSFLRDVGAGWDINRTPVWSLNYAGDVDDLDELQGAQATYGTIGGQWAFGGGWLSEFERDLFYLAGARSQDSRLLGAPGVLALGAKLATLDLGDEDKFIADLGAINTVDTTVFGRPATAAVGAVVHDLFDETGNFGDAGIRLDLGVSLVGDDGSVALDIVDVFDGTGGGSQQQGGRHVRLGTEVRIADSGTFVLGGLIRDEFSVGVRQEIPILSKLPALNFLFSHSDDEDRAELIIYLTPRIIRGTE